MKLPTETTAAALAACIGVSERRVATVKAEGRLPLTTGGRIDLAELVRRGWAATLAAKGQPVAFPEATAEQRAALRGLAPALDFTDLHDRGFAAAALLALHEAPICAALALADAGVPKAEAERAGDLLVILLWDALNAHARACGLPDSGTDGPIYAATDMLAWRDAVNWPGLFDAEGRSVVAARMAEGAAAGPVA
jgi:hypothetical protein